MSKKVGKSYCLPDSEEEVQFKKPFEKAPKIIVWFSGLEFLDKTGCSFYASAEDIQPKKFRLKYSNQMVSVTWLAFPSDSKRIQNGHSTCTETHSYAIEERYYQEKTVAFDEPFERTPRIFVAINTIRMRVGKSMDITVKISKQSAEGFTWSCTALLNSNVEVDWIAFG